MDLHCPVCFHPCVRDWFLAPISNQKARRHHDQWSERESRAQGISGHAGIRASLYRLDITTGVSSSPFM